MRRAIRQNRNSLEQKIFQQTIFWPTLESIRDGRKELIQLDQSELRLTDAPMTERSMAGMEQMLEQQRHISARRAELQGELERKWTLLQAGYQWLSVLMADTDGLSEKLKPAPSPSPETVRRVLVEGAPLYYEGYEIS